MKRAVAALALLCAGFDWNVPKVVQWAEVGEQMQTNGLPLKVFVARSQLKPAELLEHYAARFNAEGFFIPPKPLKLKGLELPRLTALDTKSWWSYLVYVWPEADGTTTLILGAADLRGRKPKAERARNELPVFPGAKAPFTSHVEFAQLLTFHTAAKDSEVIDFYRSTLPAGGWVEKEKGSGVFVRDGRRLQVLAKDHKGGGLDITVFDEPDFGDVEKIWREGRSAAP